jgi:hypothetical protein
MKPLEQRIASALRTANAFLEAHGLTAQHLVYLHEPGWTGPGEDTITCVIMAPTRHVHVNAGVIVNHNAWARPSIHTITRAGYEAHAPGYPSIHFTVPVQQPVKE